MNEAVEPTEIKRGPGRPPKEDVVLKKGNPTWKPANVDETYDKEDGYRYRWINEDQTNASKKELEGWEIVSDLTGSKTKSEVGYGRIDDGKSLTSVRKRVGQILARIPIEVAKQRDNFFNSKTNRSISALKRMASDDVGKISKDAPLHGSITMEKKGVRTIIKD